ncbi:MAG: hypothetical protein WA476_01735 [Acidobacteriaceae bacterium]
MRRLSVLRLSLAMLWAVACLAQGNETIQMRPVKAQILAGIVRAADQPIRNVHVEEWDEGWKHVLTSTMTDADGHFRLTPVGKGPMHYLRIHAPNFNVSEYPVKLSRFARAELQLAIYVGT